MTFIHAQIDQQFAHCLSDHRAAPIGMEGELFSGNALPLIGRFDQAFG
jgi:hypothetical protein